MKNKTTINIKVEFEPKKIRHIAVQCPKCKNWFKAPDICKDFPDEEYKIYYMTYTCPICKKTFGNPTYDTHLSENYQFNIEETAYPDIYKDCKNKKIIWE